jgi:hypothetical protein
VSDDLLVGLAIAFFAALIAVVSNAWLSRRNKRIEERVRFLVDAYFDLEFGHQRQHDDPTFAPYTARELDEMNRRFNKAIVAINLMGTPEQVKLSREFPQKDDEDFTPLVLALRDSLRKELGLEKLEFGHYWYEIRRKPKSENSVGKSDVRLNPNLRLDEKDET